MPVIPKELVLGQDNSIEHAPTLTEEETDILEKKKKSLEAILGASGKARYKIEVMFSHTRSLRSLSAGLLYVWESGTKFHGGGDTKAYWCPGKEKGLSSCTGVIPDASMGYGHLVCPSCGTAWKGEDVIGEIFYRLDSQKWAEVLLRHYVLLGHNADIYLKYPIYDLREASDAEQKKQLMGERLAVARGSLRQYIYPLSHIIKDTSAGSDLLERFRAFLTA